MSLWHRPKQVKNRTPLYFALAGSNGHAFRQSFRQYATHKALSYFFWPRVVLIGV